MEQLNVCRQFSIRFYKLFYQPESGHGLPHNPFLAVVSPRPIGWISTRSKDGIDNIAPYSLFNAVASDPPQVMFCSNTAKEDRHMGKDSLANIDETGVFCVNIVEYAMAGAMNKTSSPELADIDEFTSAQIEKTECKTIACSRVANAPAVLECKKSQVIRLKGANNFIIIGDVTGIHLRDDCLVDGVYDVTTYQPLARLGYMDYLRVNEVFNLAHPGS